MSFFYFDPNVFVAPDLEQQSPGQNGAFWRWLSDNGETVTDTTDGLLCILNPRRPGCAGDPYRYPNQAAPRSSNNGLIWVGLAVIILLLLFFIFKK